MVEVCGSLGSNVDPLLLTHTTAHALSFSRSLPLSPLLSLPLSLSFSLFSFRLSHPLCRDVTDYLFLSCTSRVARSFSSVILVLYISDLFHASNGSSLSYLFPVWEYTSVALVSLSLFLLSISHYICSHIFEPVFEWVGSLDEWVCHSFPRCQRTHHPRSLIPPLYASYLSRKTINLIIYPVISTPKTNISEILVGSPSRIHDSSHPRGMIPRAEWVVFSSDVTVTTIHLEWPGGV